MTDHSDNRETFSQLYPLVIASLTGEITPAQVTRLDELVCSDPQARRLYAQLIYESVNLRTWAELDREETGRQGRQPISSYRSVSTEGLCQENELLWACNTADKAAMPHSVSRSRQRSKTMWWVSVAATASLLACLLAGWVLTRSTWQPTPVVTNQELELEAMAVAEEAQSVLDLLGELERENETIVLILGQDAGAEPKSDNEDEDSV